MTCAACGEPLTSYERGRAAEVGSFCVPCMRRGLAERGRPARLAVGPAPVATGEAPATGPDGGAALRVARVLTVAAVEREAVRWLWPGRLARGKLALLDGDPGLGKSTLMLDLAARLSAGSPLPLGEPGQGPAGVLLLSAEDAVADTIRPRLEAAGADLGRVHVLAAIRDKHGERPAELPLDLDLLAREVTGREVALVVIDPLMAYLSGRVDAHRDQDTRRALHALAAMAEQTGAAVVAIRHLTKTTGPRALYRGGGSIGFVAAARSAFLVAPDPDDVSRRVLAPLKSNLAAMPPALAYRLVPDPRLDVARVEWLGQVDVAADALVCPPPDPEERSALDEAVDFLQEALAAGPQPSKDLKREAREAGIDERTLQRARRHLGVRIQSDGFPRKTTWALPTLSQSPLRETPPASCAKPHGTTGDGTTGTTGANGFVEPKMRGAVVQSCQHPMFGTTGAERPVSEPPEPCHKVAPIVAKTDDGYRLGDPGYEGFARRRYLDGHLAQGELAARVALHRALRRPERDDVAAALAAAAEEARAELRSLAPGDAERLVAQTRAELARRGGR